jgi:hypothetical protein
VAGLETPLTPESKRNGACSAMHASQPIATDMPGASLRRRTAVVREHHGHFAFGALDVFAMETLVATIPGLIAPEHECLSFFFVTRRSGVSRYEVVNASDDAIPVSSRR